MADCTHERTLRVSGKCSDMCSVHWPDGSSSDGYAPRIQGLGGGDDVEVTVCIDCHKALGLPSADDILAVQAEMAAEEEERIARFKARQAARRN
ncbi:hypothetical protein N9917_01420 [Deltaproteobacteria bacterium]|nr:hypothetical protein [Deltaproteobacteria bacterium]